MKKLLTTTLLLIAATGCMSVTNLEKELAKDPASVHLEVHSVYGTIILDRNNHLTNSVPVRMR